MTDFHRRSANLGSQPGQLVNEGTHPVSSSRRKRLEQLLPWAAWITLAVAVVVVSSWILECRSIGQGIIEC